MHYLGIDVAKAKLDCSYDGADNVTTRNDAVNGQTDSYSYDAFDRLTDAVRTTNSGQGGFALHYGYDVYGNLTNKSDAGNMVYDPTNNRLKTLSKTNGTQKQYSYDANGNMLQAGDNVVKWASFNQPLEIRNAKTNSTATFLYDANQERVQQANGTDGKSETTTYVSKAFEVTQNDNGVNDRLTQYKHQIYAGDEVVAIQIRTVKNGVKAPDETRYLHKDALGNVDTLTDSHGMVIQRISYDPFGKRTVTAGTDPDLKAWTARGFTGHEHLDNLGLIHMNARLYDPEIGRFISADTYIQAPDKSQNYNRYVYVMDNPLKYTDPSGHLWWVIAAFFVAVAIVTDIPILDMIATIAFAAALPGTFGLVGAMLKGAAAGFISGIVSNTNPFKAALWGAITAGAAWGVGHGIGGGLWKNGHGFFSEGSIGRNLVHGVAQGAISELRGGNFKSGFVGAVAGGIGGNAASRMMGGIQGISAGAVMVRTTISAVFGGLAARATGGSFENGALSAAFTHLFNYEATAGAWGTAPKPINWGAIGSGLGRAVMSVASRLLGFVGLMLTPSELGDDDSLHRVVIGEGMEKRVIPFAESIGAEWHMAGSDRALWMEHNRTWINEKMNNRDLIIDVGHDPSKGGYPTSPFYIMELHEITQRAYPLYSKYNLGY